jgi:hypothetical protein
MSLIRLQCNDGNQQLWELVIMNMSRRDFAALTTTLAGFVPALPKSSTSFLSTQHDEAILDKTLATTDTASRTLDQPP